MLCPCQDGTSSNDSFEAVALMEDGSFILTGYSEGSWNGANKGAADFVALKIDSDGKEIWKWQVSLFASFFKTVPTVCISSQPGVFGVRCWRLKTAQSSKRPSSVPGTWKLFCVTEISEPKMTMTGTCLENCCWHLTKVSIYSITNVFAVAQHKALVLVHSCVPLSDAWFVACAPLAQGLTKGDLLIGTYR